MMQHRQWGSINVSSAIHFHLCFSFVTHLNMVMIQKFPQISDLLHHQSEIYMPPSLRNVH